MGICYGHVHQTSHGEHCETDPQNCISLSAINHDFLVTTIGLNFAKIFVANPCKLNGRIGWRNELLQRHSHGFAHLPDYGSYFPSIGYGHRHGAIADANFSLPINPRWAIHCQWNAIFAPDRTINSGQLALGYIF
jgi:uncharacterized protein with beta-barrel porin domain